MVTIVRGATKKPMVTEALADFFASQKHMDGFLYIGYPIIGTPEGPFPIDAIYISESHGLVLFDLVEGLDVGDYTTRQDDAANKLESKFRSYRDLMRGRKLRVDIVPITFAPAKQNLTSDERKDYYLCNTSNLADVLIDVRTDANDYYKNLLAIVQSISTIRKGKKKRDIVLQDSRGAKLKLLEDSIANLDNIQGKAVIETVEGVQRIRGLAGSGKTIILALKAAYLHAQHPEWKIAVSFQTRSLKGQFRKLINTFVIEQTNNEPDWDNLEIIHAWGSPGPKENDGLYYSFCKDNDVEYLDYRAALHKYGRGKEFEGACKAAFAQTKSVKEVYDVILVDEAQDFPSDFLKICYHLLKDPKRLVYAYDELQSLSKRSLPPPEEIFGTDNHGKPIVEFGPDEPGKPKQDITLEKCYRNSRPVLATAHALGFGIYRDIPAGDSTGLVQMFDQESLWTDVGYDLKKGRLEGGEEVSLARTPKSSPEFLEQHSPFDDLIEFIKFDDFDQQDAWLVENIKKNINEDELRTDDIIVINPDPLSTRKMVAGARQQLFENGINSHLAGVDTSPDIFFDNETSSVAFTGIYRAKGNEAGMVYIINAQDCFSSFGNMATIRNQLFTAITRSKAWVRVLGVGPFMDQLKVEYSRVKEHNFSLDFKYPTAEERKKLNIINRDMTKSEKEAVRTKQENLNQLLDDLENGKVFMEDLGESQLERLKALLNRD